MSGIKAVERWLVVAVRQQQGFNRFSIDNAVRHSLSREAAETLTRIKQWQVSRWRNALADIDRGEHRRDFQPFRGLSAENARIVFR
jgi:hypothetical protein